MTAVIQRPRGTLDWLPPRVGLRQRAVAVAVDIFERAGYRQVVTPTFEDTGLFARSSGDGSDIVRKEMYSFHDRSDRSLTLRPEGTAPVVRAYLENGLSREAQPVKLWYFAPMFRYAAVQRGRYREHWQFGVEAIGSEDPAVDAEVIALQGAWYRALGLPGVRLRLNSIGDETCRPAYRELLVAYLDQHLDRLSADSRARRDVNPLRVFDSKDPTDREIVADAPVITDHLCDACAEHFAQVRAFLDARGVAHEVDPTIVRGLDFYTRTAWEYEQPELGGQAALGGAGRYDGLAELIGGDRAPGVGFGSGIERVVLTLEMRPPPEAGIGTDVFVVVDGAAARPRLHALLDELRGGGLRAEADLAGRSRKGQLRQAARLGARAIIVVGPDEWSRGVAILDRDEVSLDVLVAKTIGRLAAT